MIITFSNLGNYGRLGNQMFQYAIIRSISFKKNVDYIIPDGNYDLLKLNVKKSTLNKDFSDRISFTIFNEKYFHFDKSVFNINSNTDFVGYFQSYKYFDCIRDTLIEDFSFKHSIEDISSDIYSKLIDGFDGVVSVHVRRGDYLNYPTIHPVCSLDYYNRCISYFDNIGNFMYFICSDDMLWAKKYIKPKNVFYSSFDTIVDLSIMMRCNHHIISNSSFSWWAAYLCRNENKIIKCPEIWFGKDGPQDYYDLIPNDWSREAI